MSQLNLLHPTGMKRQGGLPALLVFDAPRLKRAGYGFKRLEFMLELCLDQGVEVYEGDTYTVLETYLKEHGVDHLVVQTSFDEELKSWLNMKAQQIKVTWIEDELMTWNVDLPRPSFFKFYQNIEPHLRKRAQRHG